MSRLRARCPDCRTLTAVSIGPEYECHSCGRFFGAGLIRVPRAWGRGGEAMARVLGAGFTALLPDGRNVEPARRLAVALGLWRGRLRPD